MSTVWQIGVADQCAIIFNSVLEDRLLDSLVLECWLRVQEVQGSIPSQGPRHTKDVIKMVPVVPVFGTRHLKTLALYQELRWDKKVTDTIWYENPSKSEVIGPCGGDKNTE